MSNKTIVNRANWPIACLTIEIIVVIRAKSFVDNTFSQIKPTFKKFYRKIVCFTVSGGEEKSWLDYTQYLSHLIYLVICSSLTSLHIYFPDKICPNCKIVDKICTGLLI